MKNPKVAFTINTDVDVQPQHVLLVRGTASLEIVDGIPTEYPEASRKSLPQEQWEPHKNNTIDMKSAIWGPISSDIHEQQAGGEDGFSDRKLSNAWGESISESRAAEPEPMLQAWLANPGERKGPRANVPASP